jgi:ABC-2 type transport system permease protein
MILKELRQLRRDRRTLAMLIALPVLLLTVFGYAARFDINEVPTAVVGPGAELAAGQLQEPFNVVLTDVNGDAETARNLLRDNKAVIAVVAALSPTIYIDGTQLFSAQSALRRATTLPEGVDVEILFNPELSTAAVMVPALIGLVLTAVGTIITSLGVVRERQEGTLEQLAVMPLRPSHVIVGKVAPYFLVGILDLILITAAGLLLFDVPFRGSVPILALGSLLFLLVVLGMGILISTVSQAQGEAIQLAIMTLMPQVLLSGMIFPLDAMPWGIRWIAYILPLTYFVVIVRGVFLKATPIGPLTWPLLALAILAVVVLSLAVLRFRRDLAPAAPKAATPKPAEAPA